jgi:hypothetical protein
LAIFGLMLVGSLSRWGGVGCAIWREIRTRPLRPHDTVSLDHTSNGQNGAVRNRDEQVLGGWSSRSTGGDVARISLCRLG